MSDSPSRGGAFSALHQLLKSGQITRRQFLTRATALGVGLPVATFVINATSARAQDSATPSASPEEGALLSTRPTNATENQTRGAGGEIKILVAQAPSSVSVHVASGGADIGAASPVTEPLLSYAPDGTLLATLASEVPTVENGGVSADLTAVTFKLLPDVLWSDGQPFSADDVVFTYEWIINPANQSIEQTTYEVVESVEAVDPLTVNVVFKNPQLAWYIPFTSGNRGGLYPKHYWDGKDLQTANDAFRSAPVGTGPYVVDSITPLDQVLYSANPNYREPAKPYFASINLKGSTDAVTSVQAVIQTGEWDLFDNPQITPDVLAGLLESGDKGTVYGVAGTGIEKLEINFSDPRTDVDGEKSQKDTPHPFFSDPAVRQALSLSIDRETISTRFYSGPPIEPPGRNILAGIGLYDSPNTSAVTYDPAAAAKALDDAGWILDGDERSKDGVTIAIDYVTTVNDVRQKTQAVLKNAWEALGIKVNLKSIDGGVFFDGSVGNDQNFTHFYSDLQMYTDGPTSTFPINYMQYWYAGANGDNIAQKENNWNGTNKSRFASAEYDALYDQLALETDAASAADLFVQLNDFIIDNNVQIPIVQRAGTKYAVVHTLRRENIAENSFEALFWNIANWNRNE